MPLRPIELSSAVARGFVADMRAFRAGRSFGRGAHFWLRPGPPSKRPRQGVERRDENEKPARRLARKRAGKTAPTTRGDGAALGWGSRATVPVPGAQWRTASNRVASSEGKARSRVPSGGGNRA